MYSLTRVVDRLPARQDAERHQEGGQEDEQQRDAVDAHMVGDAEPSQAAFSTNWKRGGRMSKPRHRNSESAKVTSVVHSAMIAGVAVRALALAAHEQDQERADQRQEGDGGEDRPVDQSRAALPAKMIQVTSAATPISMAKA